MATTLVGGYRRIFIVDPSGVSLGVLSRLHGFLKKIRAKIRAKQDAPILLYRNPRKKIRADFCFKRCRGCFYDLQNALLGVLRKSVDKSDTTFLPDFEFF